MCPGGRPVRRRWGCAEGEERARSAGGPAAAEWAARRRGPEARLESVGKVITPGAGGRVLVTPRRRTNYKSAKGSNSPPEGWWFALRVLNRGACSRSYCGRLELDGSMLEGNGKVLLHTRSDLLQDLWCVARLEALVVDHDVRGDDGQASADRGGVQVCLLYTSPSPRDKRQSRMPSSA